MGSQVIAVCRCGVNTKIAIGGGRTSYKTLEYFPGFCRNCKDVIQLNLKDKFPVCNLCMREIAIPYNDPRLIGVVGKKEVSRSYGNILTDGSYLCPSCRQFNLRFTRDNIFWD